jgi:hypothetical protein
MVRYWSQWCQARKKARKKKACERATKPPLSEDTSQSKDMDLPKKVKWDVDLSKDLVLARETIDVKTEDSTYLHNMDPPPSRVTLESSMATLDNSMDMSTSYQWEVDPTEGLMLANAALQHEEESISHQQTADSA